MATKLSVKISNIPPLPDGFSGTADDIIQHIANNAEFEADGDFLVGQIGGTKPIADIGIWISGGTINLWNGSEYLPLESVPVGAVLDLASGSATPPDNFLLCDGRALARAGDYALLFAKIGTTWGGGADGTHFNLPDSRGRVAVGAGTGDHRRPDGTVDAGKNLASHSVGDYFGESWPRNEPFLPSSGASTMPEALMFIPPKKPGDKNSGALIPFGSLVGAVSQPAIVCTKIIRYK